MKRQKKVSERIKRDYPEVEWKVIAGARDVITHHYFGVDYNIVWDITKKDLPRLKKQIEKILEDLEKQGSD